MPWVVRAGTPVRTLLTVVIGVAVLAPAAVTVTAQEQFQFFVSARDALGRPVLDIAREDVVFTENGLPNEVVKVEPFAVPVRLTLAVDNSSASALSHIRSGLTALVRKLSADIEVELITIAPQPRRVVRATTNRQEIYRGINGFAPEEPPHFTDALVEFSRRYEEEFRATSSYDSIPVMVMLSTTAPDVWSYSVPEVSKALTFLRARRAKVYVSMLAERTGDALTQLNDSRQVLIALPAVESTGGKYEALAISNRLATLLPEWGDEINQLHRKFNNQSLVTVRRQEGLVGPLRNPEISLAREGLVGEVSLEGLPQLSPPPD